MKKLFIALILLFYLYGIIQAQEPIKIYLPIIFKDGNEMPQVIERWKVISPIETTNMVLNPSGETTGNYSALSGATVTRSSTYQKYGMYSFRVQSGSNGQGISLILSALSNSVHFVTARIRGQLPVGLRFIIGTGLKTPRLIEKVDTQWSLYGVEFNAAESNGQTELHIVQVGNGLGDYYVDAIQTEAHEFWTSYCDGDQEGCYWNGSAHMTTSTRSGKSRAGGQVKDLYQDYGFLVDKVIGAGSVTRDLGVDEYAFLPGGELNNIKIHPREWSLIGRFIADSEGQVFQNRQDLIKLLRKNPQKESTKFLFYHLKGVREIKAFFAGGLEGDQSVFYDSWITEDDDKWAQLNKYTEKAAIQLRSPDPYFYGQGDKAVALNVSDSATFRIIAARLKSTGQWDNLGPPAAPGTAVYTDIRAIAEDDTYIYIGGDFQNFDNQANCDYICRYNKQTGVYSPMSTGLNNIVRTIVVGPNGLVYIGGDFTNFLVVWDGTSLTTLGNPTAAPAAITRVSDMVFGNDGILYIGGNFANWAGIANADNIVSWSGTGYNALSTGADNVVFALTYFGSTLYAGGNFGNIGGVAVNQVASWNGTAFAAMGSGLGATVFKMRASVTGLIYAVGVFSVSGNENVSVFDGNQWIPLGDGLDSAAEAVEIGPDGVVYVGGEFESSFSGLTPTLDFMAKWNGYAWSHLDIDLPANTTAYAFHTSKYVDPVVPQKYDLYVGFDTTGTGYFADKITVTNEGSVDVFPKFVFKRDGGTVITLLTIRNESTGRELLLNYNLLDGEQLTVDLTPTKKSITSSYFGPRLDAILANSDFGTFALEVGDNNITAFATDEFALYPSSFESFMVWKETYESYD